MAIKSPSSNKESCKSNPVLDCAHMLAVIWFHINNLVSLCISSAVIQRHHSENWFWREEKIRYLLINTLDLSYIFSSAPCSVCVCFFFFSMKNSIYSWSSFQHQRYTHTFSPCSDLTASAASLQWVCFNPSRADCDQTLMCCCCECECAFVNVLNSSDCVCWCIFTHSGSISVSVQYAYFTSKVWKCLFVTLSVLYSPV